jgi:hypothetical protein
MAQSAALRDRPADHLGLGNFSPSPLVNWTALIAADTPTEEPTPYRLKALRARNEATAGVRVTLRGGQRAQGTAAFHSVLSVWSTRLRQLGHAEQADRLRAAGSSIENTYRRYLRAYLSHHVLEELPNADFFPRLVKDTAAQLVDISLLSHEGVLFVGQVKGRHGNTWRIEGRDDTGALCEANVLDRVLARQNLTHGAIVIVIERMVGNAAVTEVEPAVRVPSDTEVIEGPPFGDDEYAELAARYRDTGGRAPNADERAELQAAHSIGSLPGRKMSLKE